MLPFADFLQKMSFSINIPMNSQLSSQVVLFVSLYLIKLNPFFLDFIFQLFWIERENQSPRRVLVSKDTMISNIFE